jgi:hypothetical protein
MKITGVVLDKDNKPELFAKVVVTDYKGIMTPKKIGATTDGEGKFSLDVTNKDDNYLTATSVLGEKSTTTIKDNISDYTIRMGDEKSQQLEEVVVTANRKNPPKPPKPPKSTEPKKPNFQVDSSKYKKRLKIALFVLLGLVLVGGTIYVVRKNK